MQAMSLGIGHLGKQSFALLAGDACEVMQDQQSSTEEQASSGTWSTQPQSLSKLVLTPSLMLPEEACPLESLACRSGSSFTYDPGK